MGSGSVHITRSDSLLTPLCRASNVFNFCAGIVATGQRAFTILGSLTADQGGACTDSGRAVLAVRIACQSALLTGTRAAFTPGMLVSHQAWLRQVAHAHE